MKFKYYLRGIGIGVIFASIIFLVAYRENIPAKLSDDEIIQRAKQLGMVEADDPINKLIDKNSSESTDDKASENDINEIQVTSEISTEQATDQETITTTEAITDITTEVEEKTTESKTEAPTTEAKENKEKTNDTKVDNSIKTDDKKSVEITVDRGSSSYPVCQKLEELGLIDDAAKFDDYLIENGYANRISVGTHKLTKGMDYHTIAELISDPLE